MQKTVLLINKGKSFMVVTIAKSFTDAGYKVVEVEPTMGNYEEAYRRSQAERHNDNQTFDYDNLMYLLGELAGYRLEEKDRQKLQLLQEVAQVPDWERLKELIK